MASSNLPIRRGALVCLTLVLGIALAACSADQTDATATATDSPTTAASVAGESEAPSASVETGLNTGGALEITANDEEFDSTVIQATAGESFDVFFINNDGDDEHNFAVFTEEGGELIAASDIIEGGQTTEVTIPALDAGEYYFVCQLHDEMNGTLIVEG